VSVVRGNVISPVRIVVRTRMAAHRPERTVGGTPGGCFWCARARRMVSRAPRSECRSKCRLEAVGYQPSAVSHAQNTAKSAKGLRYFSSTDIRPAGT
jgi:hypothetical protein